MINRCPLSACARIARLNSQNGMSPFDWAAKDGNTDIMFELFAPVASVPDVGVLDDCGESAMSLAMRHEHPEASHKSLIVSYKDPPPL